MILPRLIGYKGEIHMFRNSLLEKFITVFAIALMVYSVFVIGGGIGEFNDWFSHANKAEAVYIIAVGVGGLILGLFLLGLVQLLQDNKINISVQRNTQQLIKHFLTDMQTSQNNPEKLEKFKSLLDQDIITQEEYDKKKKELM